MPRDDHIGRVLDRAALADPLWSVDQRIHDYGPVLAPIELEGFTERKGQRHKGASPSGSCVLLLLLTPTPRKCGHPIIRAGEAQRAQVCVDLLERSALLTRSLRFGAEPLGKLRCKSVKLARTLAFGISRQHRARADVAPDRVS